jgi:hypothetical protein
MKQTLILIFFALSPFFLVASPGEALRDQVAQKYEQIEYKQKPSFEVFEKAVIGYLNLDKEGKLANNELLTIIDFSKSSNQKRIWVINMKNNKVVYHNLVSHGKNTGNEFAKYFSNTPNSNKSSLGFYVTAENYIGKHGVSLRLDGMEKGINDNARKRAIVMHSAKYVDPSYTKSYGRIGRSFGCPAIPLEGHEKLLKQIAGGSCLYIHFPDKEYDKSSRLNNMDTAYQQMLVMREAFK